MAESTVGLVEDMEPDRKDVFKLFFAYLRDISIKLNDCQKQLSLLLCHSFSSRFKR